MASSIEYVPLFEDTDTILEEVNSEHGDRNYYLTGIYTECEHRNNNRRIYPKDIVEREISNKIMPKIASNTAFGEFGHPKSMADMPYNEPSRISHRIVEITQDGNIFRGKAVLIPEGLGKIAIGMVKTGGVLSMSSRGIGSVNKSTGIVEGNYSMFTYDIVLNPGMKNANQSAVLENRELIVGELGEFSEDEWNIIERNRSAMLEASFFAADLMSSLRALIGK